MEPQLGWMRAFVAVAEELHFGRAAMRLGLSQPQVSRQVRALEDSLGVELLRRTPRHTELTDAGRALLASVRETLASADGLLTRAASVRRGGSARVNVGFLWSTLSGYVPPLVAGAAERHRELDLGVSQLTFLEVLPALRRGDVDLVIGRPMWQEHELVEVRLCRERALIALAEDHPLARQERIELTDLDREPMVAFHRRLVPSAYDGMIERARAAGVEMRIVQHVRSASEALALVSAGVGVYRLPASAAPSFPGVVYRELSGLPSATTLVHRPLPASAVRAVIDLAEDLFGDADSASHDVTPALVNVDGAA
jgi:DNA-binding transcriptional LysR family regulator